jgi:hypothetical protein
MDNVTEANEHAQRAQAEGWRTGLDALHTRIAGRFARVEMRTRVRHYLEGLLSRVERRIGWQLSEALGESGPQGAQRLLNRVHWDAEAVRDDLRTYVVEQLGDPRGRPCPGRHVHQWCRGSVNRRHSSPRRARVCARLGASAAAAPSVPRKQGTACHRASPYAA